MTILRFPYTLNKPINSYPDKTAVYRLRADKIPKGEKEDILQVNTERGICYIRMSEVESAPVYEQVFKIKDKPMSLRQIVVKPISAEQKERIENDSYWTENISFINSLLKP